MYETKSSNVMLIIILVLVSITTLCSIIVTVLTVRNAFNWNNIDNKVLDNKDFSFNSTQSDVPTANIEEKQNSTVANENNNANVSENIDTSNARVANIEQPLGMNEWGLSGKYISGNYVDVPVSITKVTRGNNVKTNVKNWFDNQNAYKYTEPEDGVEWAVVNYKIDLSNIDTNNYVNKEMNSEVRGTDSNYTSIIYNNKRYYASTVYASDRDEIKSAGVYEAQFITQLPIGCTDYLIGMGNTYNGSGSISYFKVE